MKKKMPRIVWRRSKTTQTGHAFEDLSSYSLCHLITLTDTDRPARSRARRCKMCERAIARIERRLKYGSLA